MKMWNDHFSGHAHLYAKARPTYPPALFEWLAKLAPSHDLAVDVGTGNGQAAILLADHFKKVVAFDASAEQVKQARPHERVSYGVAPAEELPIEDHSAAIIVAAQAAHWFELPKFFAECDRVLVPGGLVVLLSYGNQHISPEIDAIIDILYSDILASDWAPERDLVESGYASINLPFDEITDKPKFEIALDWPVEQFLNYLRSWSATQRHAARTLMDPVCVIEHDLRDAWGAGNQRVVWPINMRVAAVGLEPAAG